MAAGERGSERRHTERPTVELPVAFRQGSRLIEARVINISRGGMCIQTADVLNPAQQAFFEVTHPETSMKFHVEAKVVWSQPRSRIRQRRHKRPGLMGLQFVASRFLPKAAIDNIIGSLSPVA